MIKEIREWLLNRLDSFWDKRIDIPDFERDVISYRDLLNSTLSQRGKDIQAIVQMSNPLFHHMKLAQIDRDIEMLRAKILKAKKQKKRRSDLDKQHQELVRQRLEAERGSGVDQA